MRKGALENQIHMLPKISAIITFSISAGMLLLWLGFPSQKDLVATLMKANTAFLFLLVSAAVWILNDQASFGLKDNLRRVLSACVALVGALTLSQYVLGVNFGIDQLIATDALNAESSLYPGRMSPTAALCFVLLGLGLLFLDSPKKTTKSRVSTVAFSFVLLISTLSIIGYLFDEKEFYQFGPFIRISWPTAFCFWVISIGILLGRPAGGPFEIISSAGLGGIAARRLLPLVVLLPFTLGWLLRLAERQGLLDLRFAFALFVVCLIVLLSIIMVYSANQIEALSTKLVESEERFRQLSESLTNQVFHVMELNPHRISYVSPSYEKIWGKSLKSLYENPHSFLERIHPDDRPKMQSMIELQDSGKATEIEYRLSFEDGAIRWIKDNSYPILNADGVAFRAAGIAEDFTERKRIEEHLGEEKRNLEKVSRDLEKAVVARDDFLSIASHELKTPLSSLKLYTQLMKRGIEKGDPEVYSKARTNQMVEQTEKQVNRLSRLIDDMLDISRIRSGNLSIDPEEFDFCDLVKDTAERLKSLFLSANCGEPQLELCEPANGEWDKMRMEQVVTNLLTNAIRYGKGKPVSVKVSCAADSVLLEVQDNGIGIAKENFDVIFDRFERAVAANEVSGLGLGLYITKQIVISHGGKIWVESELGVRTSFFVNLPRRPPYITACNVGDWGGKLD